MKITVLPYIDPNQLNKTTSDKSVKEKTAVSSTDSFQTTLDAAKEALSALTVDLIAKQDVQKINDAAKILSSSSIPQLQEIGEVLSNTSDRISQNQTEGKVNSAETGQASTEQTQTEQIKSEQTNTEQTNTEQTNTEQIKPEQTVSQETEEDSTDFTLSGSSKNEISLASISQKLSCPDEYQSFFREASDTYGVDVALLEAVAKAESNFRADAVSSSGAIGIMQLMPFTAEELGVNAPYDPRENIMGGAKLLASLLDKYDGDKELALAAYNAGSGNVDKYGGIPPFQETQNYVPKVLGFYQDATQ